MKTALLKLEEYEYKLNGKKKRYFRLKDEIDRLKDKIDYLRKINGGE